MSPSLGRAQGWTGGCGRARMCHPWVLLLSLGVVGPVHKPAEAANRQERMEQRDGHPDAPAWSFGVVANETVGSQHRAAALQRETEAESLGAKAKPGFAEGGKNRGSNNRATNPPALLLLPAVFCCSWPCTVARDGAFARRSLLHAKHAGSLQDPAAFCTALLQRGWGTGFSAPRPRRGGGKAAGWSLAPSDTLPGLCSPPKTTPARAQRELLRARELLQCVSSSCFASCRDVQAQASFSAYPMAFCLPLFLLPVCERCCPGLGFTDAGSLLDLEQQILGNEVVLLLHPGQGAEATGGISPWVCGVFSAPPICKLVLHPYRDFAEVWNDTKLLLHSFRGTFLLIKLGEIFC